MQPSLEVRRLAPADAAAYRALRLEGFAAHPLEFRYSPADEEALTLAETERRLAESFVVGSMGRSRWRCGPGRCTSTRC